LTTGGASITGTTGTGFTNITSTLFSGNVNGTTATLSGTVTGGSLTDGTLTSTGGTITGATSITSTAFTGALTGNVTGNVTGTVSSLSNHDTDDLSEGTAKFFTDARARSAISVGGDLTYNSSTGVISFTQTEGDITAITTNSSSGLSGGVTVGAASLSVNTSNGVKKVSNNVVLDYETVSSAPSSVGSTSTGHLWFVI
jgi:hypothetical protein